MFVDLPGKSHTISCDSATESRSGRVLFFFPLMFTAVLFKYLGNVSVHLQKNI